jgi:hypothetical protein
MTEKKPALKGFLEVYQDGTLFGGWRKRFFVVKAQQLLIFDESMVNCLHTLKLSQVNATELCAVFLTLVLRRLFVA